MNHRQREAGSDPLPAGPAGNYEIQQSRMLQTLLENLESGQRLVVLNIGAALPESIRFLANFRCKLFVTDLLFELPLSVDSQSAEEDSASKREKEIADILAVPAGVKLDIVFFWESLNYLGAKNISALMQVLKPHLHRASKGHCFAVHNAGTEEAKVIHGIHDAQHLSVRPRSQVPAQYQPLPQGRLLGLMEHFVLDRSVLMRDQRLELLLTASL